MKTGNRFISSLTMDILADPLIQITEYLPKSDLLSLSLVSSTIRNRLKERKCESKPKQLMRKSCWGKTFYSHEKFYFDGNKIITERWSYARNPPNLLHTKRICFDGNHTMVTIIKYKQLESIREYVDGELTVESTYLNGELQSRNEYRNGKRHGVCIWWKMNYSRRKNNNLYLYTCSTYVDGTLNGLHTEYHQNGQKLEEGMYVNWEKDGIWRKWYKSTKLLEEATYKYGELRGTKTTYYKNRKKKYQADYCFGKRHGIATAWNKNGSVKSQIEWNSGTCY